MNTSLRGQIKKKVMKKIMTSAPHSVFFISDFVDTGSPETIRKIFFQATMDGAIERVSQGIYVKPKESRFGRVPISLEKIAQEIAERDKCQILPTGSTAANMIGLSTQIPMNLTYITTGSTRTIEIGNRKLNFRHASPKNFASKGKIIPLLIQGLREVGEKNMTDLHLASLQEFIKKSSDPDLKEDLLLAPVWMQKLIKKILYKNETLATT